MFVLKDIGKKFGQKVIFEQLNVSISEGEILSIVGESGGGKTTLLRILAGLETVTSGEILFDGEKVEPTLMDQKDQIMGIVFQDFQLFPHLTVMENIILAPTSVLKMSRAEATQEAGELLATLGLKEKEELYPYQLSGGQKQRVALARALAMKPRMIGYDEPTSALDPGLRKQVEELILSLKKTGMTQIVVTHDMEFAKNISDNLLEIKSTKELEA